MNKKEHTAKNEDELGIKAKKSLGQNFLNSDGALDSIIKAGRVTKNDTVLEIGPGKGALTKRLLDTGAKVIAIEKDDRLIPILQELFAKEIQTKKLTLIHDDILEFDVSTYGLKTNNYKLIANIPYYITGEITRKFLSGNFQPSLIVVLVQKEVAERITTAIQGSSKVKEGKESILSISVKVYGEPKYIQTVKAGCFFPPPKVDSAILLIDNISKKNFELKTKHSVIPAEAGIQSEKKDLSHEYFSTEKSLDPDSHRRAPSLKLGPTPISTRIRGNDSGGEVEQKFFEIVKAGFAHKRKTLSSNLKQIIPKEKLTELGIKENERAENLSLEQWLDITNSI